MLPITMSHSSFTTSPCNAVTLVRGDSMEGVVESTVGGGGGGKGRKGGEELDGGGGRGRF